MSPTIEEIQDFILNSMHNAIFQPTQRNICGPRIQENIKRLLSDEIPPAIKVADGLIIEGHHRFAAGMFVGKLPEYDPATAPKNVQGLSWSDVNVENIWWAFD